jgi:hypothetical protein
MHSCTHAVTRPIPSWDDQPARQLTCRWSSCGAAPSFARLFIVLFPFLYAGILLFSNWFPPRLGRQLLGRRLRGVVARWPLRWVYSSWIILIEGRALAGNWSCLRTIQVHEGAMLSLCAALFRPSTPLDRRLLSSHHTHFLTGTSEITAVYNNVKKACQYFEFITATVCSRCSACLGLILFTWPH